MGNFSDSLLIGKDTNGKRILLRRCNSNLCHINKYRNCLNSEINQGKELDHPNLPQYLDLCKDEEGEYVAFKYVPAIPLFNALLENSYNLNNKKESTYVVNQIIDAVQYMHQNGILHLNISPCSIYITKGKNKVTLFNPLSYYIINDISYATFNGLYSDPNLFNDENQPDEKNDIYSIGKIIEYIYSYSNETPWTRYIVYKATNTDSSKRYSNIEELKKDFNRKEYADIITYSLKIVALIILLFFFYLGFKGESISQESIKFREETNLRHKTNADNGELMKNSLANEIDSIINSTSKNSTANNDQERIFKKEFRKEAIKIINKIYSKDMMGTTAEKFQEASIKHFSELDILQKKMALKYNISTTYSTSLANQVIEELTESRLKDLKKN